LFKPLLPLVAGFNRKNFQIVPTLEVLTSLGGCGKKWGALQSARSAMLVSGIKAQDARASSNTKGCDQPGAQKTTCA
jgi:hypothetical protein